MLEYFENRPRLNTHVPACGFHKLQLLRPFENWMDEFGAISPEQTLSDVLTALCGDAFLLREGAVLVYWQDV